MPPANFLILSCEHAVDHIPAKYRPHLELSRRRGTHWAYDIGALRVARALARELDAPLYPGAISRLVLDLNRSPHHPSVMSSFSRTLHPDEQCALLSRYHKPHWSRVHGAIAAALAKPRSRVVHIAVHSFTPVWKASEGVRVVRAADVGLLYDPRRSQERTWAEAWMKSLARAAPQLRVRRNYPYLGRADGLPTATRRRWPQDRYIGFELELNQKRLGEPRSIIAAIATSLRELLATNGILK